MTTACNALLGNDDKQLESGDGGPDAAVRVSADGTADRGGGDACESCADRRGSRETSADNDVTTDVAGDEGGCGSGLIACEGGCVDLTSASSCGACDNACDGSTFLCASVNGTYACTASCTPASPTQCGSVCVDTTKDPNHCGACPNACSTSVPNAQPVCASGACAFECRGGYSLCSGACVDEQTDSVNCGGCGSGHVCSGSASCQAGVCCTPIALPPSINVDATHGPSRRRRPGFATPRGRRRSTRRMARSPAIPAAGRPRPTSPTTSPSPVARTSWSFGSKDSL
jgi:hypothetical protein